MGVDAIVIARTPVRLTDRDFKDPQAPKVNRDLAEGGRDVN